LPQRGRFDEVCAFSVAVRPLDVHILGANQPLSAGRRYDLLCQSSGSRPPAAITWWRNGQRLTKTKETVSFTSILFYFCKHASLRHFSRFMFKKSMKDIHNL